MHNIHAHFSASISELKKNPTALLHESAGEPIAILNHNKPAAYLIHADLYVHMLNLLEEAGLSALIKDRLKETSQAIKAKLDDL
jgi:antitoxin StbD